MLFRSDRRGGHHPTAATHIPESREHGASQRRAPVPSYPHSRACSVCPPTQRALARHLHLAPPTPGDSSTRLLPLRAPLSPTPALTSSTQHRARVSARRALFTPPPSFRPRPCVLQLRVCAAPNIPSPVGGHACDTRIPSAPECRPQKLGRTNGDAAHLCEIGRAHV